MFKKFWDSASGKKLVAAASIAVGYGLGALKVKYPAWPWDELIWPLVIALGGVGVGHRIVKAQDAKP